MGGTDISTLSDAVIREYLARKGCRLALLAFDEARPRDASSITNRRDLAVSLHIERLVKHNKEKEQPHNTFLEIIVDYFSSRATSNKAAPNENTPKQQQPNNEALISQKVAKMSLTKREGNGSLVEQHVRLHTQSIIQPGSDELTQLKPKADFKVETKIVVAPQSVGIEQAKVLDSLVFGGKAIFQTEWHQGLFFSDQPELRYGLIQLQGGPCGVIAAVQAFVLKEILFSPNFLKSGFNPSDHVRTSALIISISEILWQAGGSKSAKVVLPPSLSKKFQIYYLAEFKVHTFDDFASLKQFILDHQAMFTEREGTGVISLVYSAILSRGISQVQTDMDSPKNTLLAPHRYCSQELVNLLLVGYAASNVFDGTMDVGGATLKGISSRSSIGYLTLMEKLGYCQVGDNFKNSLYPIWIIYSESHYSLLFSSSKLITTTKFDVYYYDELGNQDEQYKISIDTSPKVVREFDENDLVPPIEMCICTKWATAICDWNGSEPLL